MKFCSRFSSSLRASTLRAYSLYGAAAVSLCVLAATGCSQSSGPPVNTPAAQSHRPDPQAPLADPPAPPAATANPVQGAKLFVDPNSLAMLNANSARQRDPGTATVLDRIAQQPQGIWMGDWNSDIFRAVEHYVQRAIQDNAVPVMIAYNIPHRDAAAGAEGECHSCGGLDSKLAYQRWIRDFHAGIGENPAIVVLEPDALPGLDALAPELQKERLFLLRDAVKVLRQNPRTAVYIDAGNPAWVPAKKMAELLRLAGVEFAHGFALNVSNYRTTEECLSYGREISALIGDKHFVIDTSRNGAGPYLEAKNDTETWCNPPGRKIGKAPTFNTGEAAVDAYLWLKRPGESDGECSGGPRAGVWWPEMAMKMAQ